jgi:hypothetical protein
LKLKYQRVNVRERGALSKPSEQPTIKHTSIDRITEICIILGSYGRGRRGTITIVLQNTRFRRWESECDSIHDISGSFSFIVDETSSGDGGDVGLDDHHDVSKDAIRAILAYWAPWRIKYLVPRGEAEEG